MRAKIKGNRLSFWQGPTFAMARGNLYGMSRSQRWPNMWGVLQWIISPQRSIIQACAFAGVRKSTGLLAGVNQQDQNWWYLHLCEWWCLLVTILSPKIVGFGLRDPDFALSIMGTYLWFLEAIQMDFFGGVLPWSLPVLVLLLFT